MNLSNPPAPVFDGGEPSTDTQASGSVDEIAADATDTSTAAADSQVVSFNVEHVASAIASMTCYTMPLLIDTSVSGTLSLYLDDADGKIAVMDITPVACGDGLSFDYRLVQQQKVDMADGSSQITLPFDLNNLSTGEVWPGQLTVAVNQGDHEPELAAAADEISQSDPVTETIEQQIQPAADPQPSTEPEELAASSPLEPFAPASQPVLLNVPSAPAQITPATPTLLSQILAECVQQSGALSGQSMTFKLEPESGIFFGGGIFNHRGNWQLSDAVSFSEVMFAAEEGFEGTLSLSISVGAENEGSDTTVDIEIIVGDPQEGATDNEGEQTIVSLADKISISGSAEAMGDESLFVRVFSLPEGARLQARDVASNEVTLLSDQDRVSSENICQLEIAGPMSLPASFSIMVEGIVNTSSESGIEERILPAQSLQVDINPSPEAMGIEMTSTVVEMPEPETSPLESADSGESFANEPTQLQSDEVEQEMPTETLIAEQPLAETMSEETPCMDEVNNALTSPIAEESDIAVPDEPVIEEVPVSDSLADASMISEEASPEPDPLVVAVETNEQDAVIEQDMTPTVHEAVCFDPDVVNAALSGVTCYTMPLLTDTSVPGTLSLYLDDPDGRIPVIDLTPVALADGVSFDYEMTQHHNVDCANGEDNILFSFSLINEATGAIRQASISVVVNQGDHTPDLSQASIPQPAPVAEDMPMPDMSSAESDNDVQSVTESPITNEMEAGEMGVANATTDAPQEMSSPHSAPDMQAIQADLSANGIVPLDFSEIRRQLANIMMSGITDMPSMIVTHFHEEDMFVLVSDHGEQQDIELNFIGWAEDQTGMSVAQFGFDLTMLDAGHIYLRLSPQSSAETVSIHAQLFGSDGSPIYQGQIVSQSESDGAMPEPMAMSAASDQTVAASDAEANGQEEVRVARGGDVTLASLLVKCEGIADISIVKSAMLFVDYSKGAFGLPSGNYSNVFLASLADEITFMPEKGVRGELEIKALITLQDPTSTDYRTLKDNIVLDLDAMGAQSVSFDSEPLDNAASEALTEHIEPAPQMAEQAPEQEDATMPSASPELEIAPEMPPMNEDMPLPENEMPAQEMATTPIMENQESVESVQDDSPMMPPEDNPLESPNMPEMNAAPQMPDDQPEGDNISPEVDSSHVGQSEDTVLTTLHLDNSDYPQINVTLAAGIDAQLRITEQVPGVTATGDGNNVLVLTGSVESINTLLEKGISCHHGSQDGVAMIITRATPQGRSLELAELSSGGYLKATIVTNRSIPIPVVGLLESMVDQLDIVTSLTICGLGETSKLVDAQGNLVGSHYGDGTWTVNLENAAVDNLYIALTDQPKRVVEIRAMAGEATLASINAFFRVTDAEVGASTLEEEMMQSDSGSDNASSGENVEIIENFNIGVDVINLRRDFVSEGRFTFTQLANRLDIQQVGDDTRLQIFDINANLQRSVVLKGRPLSAMLGIDCQSMTQDEILESMLMSGQLAVFGNDTDSFAPEPVVEVNNAQTQHIEIQLGGFCDLSTLLPASICGQHSVEVLRDYVRPEITDTGIILHVSSSAGGETMSNVALDNITLAELGLDDTATGADILQSLLARNALVLEPQA
ncbi:hypothetical protein CS022_01640 [Veronia nyctiphanis]|uniref:Uncharacterized protein n=1 Tax=Veronia nyctiphanis TaxID=1278244 RepID=A0A4Q0YUF1_9GAMM|nr:hypothetical protein CS022_01640 [Veronia nyctiphanis]